MIGLCWFVYDRDPESGDLQRDHPDIVLSFRHTGQPLILNVEYTGPPDYFHVGFQQGQILF